MYHARANQPVVGNGGYYRGVGTRGIEGRDKEEN